MKSTCFLCTSLIVCLVTRLGLGQGQFPVDNPPLSPATFTSSATTPLAPPQEIGLVDEKYDGIPIVDIEITGNRSLETQKILSFLTTSTNRAFDSQVVQSDVRRLYRSGLIRNVRTFTRRVPEGIIVSFEVFERPTIEQVLYLGNRGISDKQLQKQTNLEPGTALNSYVLDDARRTILDFYRSKGYPKVRVNLMEGSKPGDRRAVFYISEGHRERIHQINFIGNNPDLVSNGRLKTQIKSKPGYLRYFFGGNVSRDVIEEDIQRLTAYYRNLGYFQARVARELVYDDSGRWLTINFIIDEGPRYVVRDLSIVGNTIFNNELIQDKLKLSPGDYFNLDKMNTDVALLRNLYGSQGFIYADIKADPRFREEPGELDLSYQIREGEQFRVGKINIHIAGDPNHTRQEVVLNRLSIRPGDVIDIREIRESERRLKHSQLFEHDPAQGISPRIIIQSPEMQQQKSPSP
jgi:outer membrane protein insertion porin family